MSATLLRDNVRTEIEALILEHAGYCANRHGDTLDQIRVNQGRVDGLRTALQILNEQYRSLHG